MWCLGTPFSDGLGSVGLTVGLDDLKGVFQTKWFYESTLNFSLLIPLPSITSDGEELVLPRLAQWKFSGSICLLVSDEREDDFLLAWGISAELPSLIQLYQQNRTSCLRKLMFLYQELQSVGGRKMKSLVFAVALATGMAVNHFENLIRAPKYCYGHNPYAVCTRAGQKTSSWSLDLPHHNWFAQQIPDCCAGVYDQLWCCPQSIPVSCPHSAQWDFHRWQSPGSIPYGSLATSFQ